MIRKITAGWSLFTKFLCTLLIVLAIPVCALGITSYSRSSRLLQTQVNELIGQIVDEVNNDIDTIVMDYDYLLIRLLSQPEVFEFLRTEPDDYLSRLGFVTWFETSVANDFFLKNPYAYDIEILGKNGITYSSAGTFVRESYQFYDKVMPEDGTLSIFRLNQDNRKLISLSRRIFDGGRCVGIMVLNIKPQELNLIWEKVDLRGGDIFIIDHDNSILYQSEELEVYDDISSLLESESFGHDGIFTANIHGVPSLCVMKGSEATKWRTLICLDKKAALMPLGSFRNFLLVSVFVFLLFSLFAGNFFIRRILRPLDRLKTNMKQVGSGNWKEFSNIETQDEIGELMRGYNRMVEEIQTLLKQVQEKEREQYIGCILRQKAELQAMQSQINPHFLYNTLGTINAYAIADSKENVQRIVDSLSKMFRYATNSPLQSVAVRDEQNHVKEYLTIQALRLVQMPEIIWDIDRYMDWPMLRLTLQPVIENCFKHGFKDGVTPESRIVIQAKAEKKYFTISVTDNGAGPETVLNDHRISEDETGESIGLSNVNRRLMIVYGSEYGVFISGRPGDGLVCNLVMPSPYKQP